MAIDPMLYEKVSGRKGDPYSRMGEALAGADLAKAARAAAKEELYTEGAMRERYKWKLYSLGVVVAVGGIIALARAIFG